MTTQAASKNNRNSRRAGLAALAVVILSLGALLAPGTAAAAPGDSFGDLTSVLLAIGLMTVGVGSIVAIATRRRKDDLPVA